LFQPDDPLAPPASQFDEPWQAQALALADTMVQGGRFTATEWAAALGAALTEAEVRGAPDTLQTYYTAVLAALERLCETRAGISGDDRALRRAAWEGAYPERPELPLRIEAAGYRGRVVYFRQVPSWSRAERTQALGLRPGQRAAAVASIVLLVAMLCVAGFIARRNLRLGRGDARGALRLARYVFGVGLLGWLVSADHVFDFGEVGLVIHGLGTLLVLAAITWLFYLAIEPYVRRHWPHTLISWTRLLTGGWRDPRVGRDVLIGMGAGTAMAVMIDLFQLLPAALNGPPTAPRDYGFEVLLGAREILADLLFAQSNSALVALGLLLLLMVARQVLRREALAIAAALLVLCLPESLAIPLPLWLVLPLDMLIVLVPTIVLVRCGLLSSIVTFYVANRLIVYPLTSDLAGPSAVPTLFLGALVLGVTLLAAHVALAGRPLFRDGLSAR